MSPGYQFVDRLRLHDPHHGGLIIFFRSIFRYKKITLPLVTAFEVLAVKLKINELDYILLAIYRPGSEQLTTSFFDELISVLECVTIISSRILLAGDFNIHTEKSNNPNVVNLREIFEMFQLINHIDEPTHILGGTLDLIVTSHNIAVSEAKVYPSGIYSDHGLVQAFKHFTHSKHSVHMVSEASNYSTSPNHSSSYASNMQLPPGLVLPRNNNFSSYNLSSKN
ncbi:hypothetical protein HELRODRAFT_174351 [Helobdella robusta]|uniref:Endonuclease/exonuclease/phosphatase domain-containing protein n=1 Tax=Helobdella robusta TaxID=6412 RepID=T1F813_HELRO|nr:hypothetical protein HELRODRAFT_174351 [Helobdella robusta]ESO02899.1 hypothetical protein HELRODRAFT_174351 [Helobdella robusta]